MWVMWDYLKARWRLGRGLSLWYHPRYDALSLAKLADALGMVALRGKRVLAQLAKVNLVKAGDLSSFPLVSLADLGLFHTPAYLEKVSRPETLAHIFGIPPADAKVDEITAAVRWALSGTVAATRSVLAGEAPLAVNFGGGFHHAEPGMGSGFCVFNDIGVAIRLARRDGFDGKIAIVDLDFHQGNGNIVGFKDDPSVNNYSLHGAIWTDCEARGNYDRNLEGAVGDDAYLEALESTLPRFLDEHRPALAFYIAGNDVLDKDLLGQFSLSVAGVARRDRTVLNLFKQRRIPAVVVLGGGYSESACQGTLNLVLTAMGMDDFPPFDAQAEVAPGFRRISESLEPHPHGNDDRLNFSEADLWPDLDPSRAATLLLGRYSAYEIEREMENCGLLGKLRNLGYGDFRVSVDLRDPAKQKILVAAGSGRKSRASPQTVAEIALRRDELPSPLPQDRPRSLPVLAVEKMILSPQLKEESASGLTSSFQDLFRRLSSHLHWDGVLWKP